MPESQKEEITFSEEWLTVSFNPQIPFVRAVWSGFPRGSKYRAMTTVIAETVKQKNVEFPGTNCIFDISRLLVISYEDMDWAAGPGDMMLYNAGAEKLAFLVLGVQFEKFYLDAYQYQAQRKPANLLQRKIFKTEAEAVQWLSK